MSLGNIKVNNSDLIASMKMQKKNKNNNNNNKQTNKQTNKQISKENNSHQLSVWQLQIDRLNRSGRNLD